MADKVCLLSKSVVAFRGARFSRRYGARRGRYAEREKDANSTTTLWERHSTPSTK